MFASQVMDFLFKGVDRGAYYHFQAQREPWLDWLLGPGIFLGHWGGLILLVVLSLVLLFVAANKRSGSRKLAFLLILGWLAMELIRRLVGRDRPDTAVLFIWEPEMQRSFPSLGMFALSLSLLTLALLLEKKCPTNWRIIAAYGLAILGISYTAFSQLYFCLHYVTDVVSALVAAGALYLVGRFFYLAGRHHHDLV